MNNFFDKLPDDIMQTYNHKTKWELIKFKIKTISIEYCKNRSKNFKKRIHEIENEIEQMENKHFTEINMIRKKDLENQVDNLYEIKAKGAQIRSRARWLDEGEKITAYFLRLENKHQSHNVINRVRINDEIFSNTGDILNQLCKFYENLYSSQGISDEKIDDYLRDIEINTKLSDEDKEFFDKAPTIQECSEAVLEMKNNKSPGLDGGLPVEFYKMFWKHLKQYMFDALIKSFEDKELTNTQKCSVLSLIHKKGKLDELENYRPISLTNCDY